MRREARISVYVEYADGSVRYRHFTNYDVGSVTAMKARLKARLLAEPGVVHVAVGNALVTNHYGAH